MSVVSSLSAKRSGVSYDGCPDGLLPDSASGHVIVPTQSRLTRNDCGVTVALTALCPVERHLLDSSSSRVSPAF